MNLAIILPQNLSFPFSYEMFVNYDKSLNSFMSPYFLYKYSVHKKADKIINTKQFVNWSCKLYPRFSLKNHHSKDRKK